MAPDARIAPRTALPRWLPRLSMMTISPGLSVGTRIWRTQARKTSLIDGTIEEARRSDPVPPKRCDEGHCLPAAEGSAPFNPAAARSPPSKRRHVGLGPGFIDKDQALGIDASLMLPPLFTPALDVFAILLLCGGGFFYGSALRRAGTPRLSGDPPSAHEGFEAPQRAD